VTVSGKDVPVPGNFRVRIGTPVSDLIEAVGGLPEGTGKVVNGGPMMGKALASLDVPVTKATSGIVCIPEQEANRATVYDCIRCGKCVEVCPMGLEPYLLSAHVAQQNFAVTTNLMVTDCIECGSCSYECPSNRPLLDQIRLAKVMAKKATQKPA
jgi:electron transport complex protein RnfC